MFFDIWHITMFGPIEFILAGVLVGFCVGITGVGGGSLMTPILISLFRIEPHIAIGTDLLYAAISKFCGSMVHAKKMNIVWPIVIWLAVGSIPASSHYDDLVDVWAKGELKPLLFMQSATEKSNRIRKKINLEK